MALSFCKGQKQSQNKAYAYLEICFTAQILPTLVGCFNLPEEQDLRLGCFLVGQSMGHVSSLEVTKHEEWELRVEGRLGLFTYTRSDFILMK